jgi:hypothetical protein
MQLDSSGRLLLYQLLSDRPLHLTVEIFSTMRLRDDYALLRQKVA